MTRPDDQMAQLTAQPQHWFSSNYTIMDDEHAVADLTLSSLKEKGVLTVHDGVYEVYREGVARGDYLLEARGAVVARAKKPSAFRRSFLVQGAGRTFRLQAEAPLRRKFLLWEGAREVGALSPAGVFTTRMLVDLPRELPLPLKAFIVWLVVVIWRRDASAG